MCNNPIILQSEIRSINHGRVVCLCVCPRTDRFWLYYYLIIDIWAFVRWRQKSMVLWCGQINDRDTTIIHGWAQSISSGPFTLLFGPRNRFFGSQLRDWFARARIVVCDVVSHSYTHREQGALRNPQATTSTLLILLNRSNNNYSSPALSRARAESINPSKRLVVAMPWGIIIIIICTQFKWCALTMLSIQRRGFVSRPRASIYS